jgi:thioredoxin reductase
MKRYETEIAVIGAGAAGLCAAYEAASAGAEVLLIDENHTAGGQLFKQLHKFFGSSAHQAGERGFLIGEKLLEQVKSEGVTIWLSTVVYGIQSDLTLGVIHEGEHIVVRAKRIIVATGAKENYLAFPGSTLPGVMGAGAAQTMANINRVLPGKRIVMVGSGNVGLIVSYQLLQAGAEVLAVVEAGAQIGGYGVHAAKLRRAGVPILIRHTVLRAEGQDEVERVILAEVDETFRPIPGTQTVLDADTVALAVGLNPMTELLWMAGCRFCYLPASGGHVPLHGRQMETTVPGLYAAGDVTGVEEASTAMEEGRLAGICAAASLSYLSQEEAEQRQSACEKRMALLRTGSFGEKRREAKQEQLARFERVSSDENEAGKKTL